MWQRNKLINNDNPWFDAFTSKNCCVLAVAAFSDQPWHAKSHNIKSLEDPSVDQNNLTQPEARTMQMAFAPAPSSNARRLCLTGNWQQQASCRRLKTMHANPEHSTESHQTKSSASQRHHCISGSCLFSLTLPLQCYVSYTKPNKHTTPQHLMEFLHQSVSTCIRERISSKSLLVLRPSLVALALPVHFLFQLQDHLQQLGGGTLLKHPKEKANVYLLVATLCRRSSARVVRRTLQIFFGQKHTFYI